MVATLYLVPQWFSGYDVLLELIFALITGFVSYYSFRIYTLSNQRESKLLGISFASISFSYILWALLNYLIVLKTRALNLENLGFISMTAVYSHLIFFLIGLSTLTYMTLKVKSSRVYSLILVLAFSAIAISYNIFITFYFLAVVLLIFVMIHYFRQYKSNHSFKTFLILISFFLLWLASLVLLFSENYYLTYVSGHLLVLAAYSIILISLILIVKNVNPRSKNP